MIAVAEADWQTEDDESLLGLCSDNRRALLTSNVADFAVIGRRWQADGRAHYGLVFMSDASLPRTRHNVGRFVDAIDELMANNPEVGSFIDRIQWL